MSTSCWRGVVLTRGPDGLLCRAQVPRCLFGCVGYVVSPVVALLNLAFLAGAPGLCGVGIFSKGVAMVRSPRPAPPLQAIFHALWLPFRILAHWSVTAVAINEIATQLARLGEAGLGYSLCCASCAMMR